MWNVLAAAACRDWVGGMRGGGAKLNSMACRSLQSCQASSVDSFFPILSQRRPGPTLLLWLAC